MSHHTSQLDDNPAKWKHYAWQRRLFSSPKCIQDTFFTHVRAKSTVRRISWRTSFSASTTLIILFIEASFFSLRDFSNAAWASPLVLEAMVKGFFLEKKPRPCRVLWGWMLLVQQTTVHLDDRSLVCTVLYVYGTAASVTCHSLAQKFKLVVNTASFMIDRNDQ